ncbi:hypothetical protein [Sabulicella glaciei]|uniref:Uncharacterized protein n=1 Tax=Sabulicella glaciei TaxID=2984948 RepID=A0ABT3NW19_9PROT|nr:hypothetical protein [Roseococcus sp. MDT2-1-1]MCW8085779.1 hypothetical protein [Roseococcus sp. MDT2-1-1]
MASISSIVETVAKPVFLAASVASHVARRALGRGGEAEGDAAAPQAPRRSRGWRKHMRKVKAQQRRS